MSRLTDTKVRAVFTAALLAPLALCAAGVYLMSARADLRPLYITVAGLAFCSFALMAASLALLRRRRAERARAEEAALLATLLDQAHDAIFVRELGGRITYWNRGAAELYGWAAKEALGQVSHALLGTRESGGIADRRERLERDGLWAGELEHLTRDGGPIRVESRQTLVRRADGPPLVLEANRDISERLLAEAALGEADRRLAAILENVYEAAAALDGDLRFTFVNPQWEALFGKRRGEVVGRTFQEVFPELVGTDSERHHRRVLAERAPRQFEVFSPVVRRWLEIRLSPSGGGISSFILDINDRKLAEAARREGEERLRLALEGGQMGTFEVDLATRLARLDGAECELLDLAPGTEEISVAQFLDHIHPADRDAVNKAIARAVAEGRDYESEFRIRLADGGERWLAGRGRVVQTIGQARIIGVNFDITARKRAEAEREDLLARAEQARAEAEAATRAKDEFVTVVSHELRSPLNAILGWAQIMRRGQCDGATLSRAVEVIERSARAQQRLIEDLLDTSRVVVGKLRLETRPLNLVPVVERALDVVRPAAEARGVELESALSPEAGQVTGDADRLQQVVWNLVSNAIKFTPEGGRVGVRLERDGPHVRLTVADTGRGIAPDLLPHVFDRFRQAPDSTARRSSGLGLGLALVKHLTELHGGTVEAASEGEGRGATFTVRLPVRAVSVRGAEFDGAAAGLEGESPAPCPPPPELAGVRVLAVDDERDAREMLKVALELQGARVSLASSAAEAFGLLIGSEPGALPDVLISDINMPGEDGYDLVRRLREWEQDVGTAHARAESVPAVALTAHSRSEDRTRALLAGFQLYVTKPVEPAELAAAVASLVRRRENRSGFGVRGSEFGGRNAS